jgi:glycosyltransferase involved in cell wall biosynthesis
VDRYLALSRPVRDELVALGVPAARIDLVPDAVDVAAVERAVAAARGDGSAATRRGLAGPGEGSVVGVIGAFTREKGQDVLLAAAARAACRPRVLLHGAGPEEGRLRALAAALPGVAFVSGDDPLVTLAAVDLLVVPSRAEGLGSIVLAAQAAGVPVIAAATGGLPEIVGDGSTGLLVPAEDVPALAAALDQAHDHPGATRERARRAREAVAAYDVGRIVERTVAAYAAARASAGRGPR